MGISLVGGFNLPTPLKNDGVKVSWDYELPNIWKNKVNYRYFKPNKYTHQLFTIMKFPTEWKVSKFHGSSRHQPVQQTLEDVDSPSHLVEW